MSIGMMRTNVGAKARLNRITITSWQKVDIPKRRTKSNTKKAEICHAGREITQPNCGNVPTCLSEKWLDLP